MGKLASLGMILSALSVASFARAESVDLDDVFYETGTPEFLQAYCDTPGSGTTSNLYQGLVRLTVSGTGQARGSTPSDAFYYVDHPGSDPGNGKLYYSFTGDAREMEADGRFIGELITFIDEEGYAANQKPAYSPSHSYDFVIDVGGDSQRLTLGTGDGGLYDNTGFFDIRVVNVSIVPEPINWVLLLLGGGALAMSRLNGRRTKKS